VERTHLVGQQKSEVLQLQVLVAPVGRRRRGSEPAALAYGAMPPLRTAGAMGRTAPDRTRHYPSWVTTKRDDWRGEHAHQEM
jgi:hypothetical protein